MGYDYDGILCGNIDWTCWDINSYKHKQNIFKFIIHQIFSLVHNLTLSLDNKVQQCVLNSAAKFLCERKSSIFWRWQKYCSILYWQNLALNYDKCVVFSNSSKIWIHKVYHSNNQNTSSYVLQMFWQTGSSIGIMTVKYINFASLYDSWYRFIVREAVTHAFDVFYYNKVQFSS